MLVYIKVWFLWLNILWFTACFHIVQFYYIFYFVLNFDSCALCFMVYNWEKRMFCSWFKYVVCNALLILHYFILYLIRWYHYTIICLWFKWLNEVICYTYMLVYNIFLFTTAHPWYIGHSTSINAYGVWGVRAEVQVSRRELHTHIYLD